MLCLSLTIFRAYMLSLDALDESVVIQMKLLLGYLVGQPSALGVVPLVHLSKSGIILSHL